MVNKLFTILSVLGLFVVMAACAQTKKATKNNNTTKQSNVERPIYLESLTQRTLPGRQETPPVLDIYHIIVWNSATLPEAFYWKDGSIWASCNVSKASAVKKKITGAVTYNTEDIRMENIKKGDTLQLYVNSPLGKYIIPSEISDTTTKTIFYKTANTKWLPIPATNFRKLPDIIMP